MHLDHRRPDKGIEDPRDSLTKARRLELVRYAHACGLAFITEHMPADQIRDELRSRGLTNIKIPNRVLGADGRHVIPAGPKLSAPPPATDDGKVTVTREQLAAIVQDAVASALLRKSPERPAKPPRFKRLVERPKSEINKLRDECKRLGIHMDRRDRMPDLKAKIEAHIGQNAPERN